MKMTGLRLIGRSAAFYWRTHLGVIAGSGIGAMVLIGALMVGDSVDFTLRRLASLRIGAIEHALHSGDRYFRTELADEVMMGYDAVIAPLLATEGSVTLPDGSKRTNRVQVLGVESRFWQLSPRGRAQKPSEGPDVALNRTLAARLGVEVGDALILRCEKPGDLSRDAPLSGESDAVVAFRGTVGSIIGDEDFGRFSPLASQLPPSSIYLPLPTLQRVLGLRDRANMLLSGPEESGSSSLPSLTETLRRSVELEDFGLEVRSLESVDAWEIISNRVFLERPVLEAARKLALRDPEISSIASSTLEPGGVLTYFVNGIRHKDRLTPYSIVSAIDPRSVSFLPDSAGKGEIFISEWLGDDLGVGVGDEIELSYYVVADRRKLIEESRDFLVAGVYAMDTEGVSPEWMPEFPGLADADNCRDWEPGLPIDLDLIRPKDERYWDNYRGTPKAFISLLDGQAMWSNRWGSLTAIRLPKVSLTRSQIESGLRDNLDPARMGLRFESLRSQSTATIESPVDFGQLFTGFSSFLISAAAVLTALLFVFTIEQRSQQTGLLLAIGFHPKQVWRLLLVEGTVLALLGSLIGLVLAFVYTPLVLLGLSTIWKGAVGSVTFHFHASTPTLIGGFAAGAGIPVIAMWAAGRRQLGYSAHQLLRESLLYTRPSEAANGGGKPAALWFGVISLGGAAGLIGSDRSGAGFDSPALFFGAGSLLLLAGIAFCRAWLARSLHPSDGLQSLPDLGKRNVARRWGRSLTSVGVLASGVFIVVAVSAFHKDTRGISLERDSGTGGFALVGRSTLPIYDDLNTREGRDSLGLDHEILNDVSIVPMRLREGDDASCLNLNRALEPRLLGVSPDDLIGRNAFRFQRKGREYSSPEGWRLLNLPVEEGEPVAAIADQATVRWALGMAIGDKLTYLDDRGVPFEVQITGSVVGSILQGNILVAEERLIERFPSVSGYRYFLVDVPPGRTASVSKHLTKTLSDFGLELQSTSERLSEFQTVENTYLAIFQALGGLGLLLGSAGLGIVVVRNMLERRSEFALLRALGFRDRELLRLIFGENRWLIIWGLLVGAAAAVAAIWPTLIATGPQSILLRMAILAVAMAVLSLLSILAAAHFSLRRTTSLALTKE